MNLSLRKPEQIFGDHPFEVWKGIPKLELEASRCRPNGF